MERSVAELVIKGINSATDDLIHALAPLETNCSEEERTSMKIGLGNVVMGVAEHLLKPIYLQFPDLIPPKLRAKDGGPPYLFR